VTLIELTFVLLITGMMASLAFPPITTTWKRWQMLRARDDFVLVSSLARSAAVEQGDLVVMTLHTAAGIVVLRENDGTLIDRFDVGHNGRDVELLGDELTVCYLPRGHAHPSCGDGAELPRSVGFTSGQDTVWATVTLGRVEKQ
jgi:type II secretory pathway pseudopilin PulG